MPYRSAGAAREPTAPRTSDSLTTVDVSGAPGQHGAHGADGPHGTHAGSHGGAGAHAGPAEPGQHGGRIHVVLRQEPGDSQRVVVQGSAIRTGGSVDRFDDELAFGDAGFVDLVARGGDGGDGGWGGRGGDGAKGRSGRDATRYSSGEDGGPGGDGGDGGDGTSGARGGGGGQILVEVRDEDTHLLMLTRHEVRGGRGGKPGSNGDGGNGGPGGNGGSSYSWTETESYTDSQGQTQTRMTSHSNSGGRTGRPGRPGRPGSERLEAGAPGPPGTFEIRVTSSDGYKSYPSRYDLRLVRFQHRSANDDGVYEPEEKIHVSKIEVENVGGMPTPAHHEIHIALRDKGWIAADPGHLVLPPSLGPGQRHVFETEELTCTLGAYHPSRPTDPLAEEEVIHHRASLPDVRRDFDRYEGPDAAELGRFTVRFPVEVSPIDSLHALAPGQAARLRFRITNVSERAFGARSELGRAIAFRLFLHESELSPEQLLFFDADGHPISLGQGFHRDVPELGPGASVDVEGTVALPDDAPFYRAGRMWLSLELGAISDPLRLRPIAYRAFDVRVSRPMSGERADVLLAVNNRTTAEELAGWETLAGSLGLTAGVLDVSLQGGIDFDVADGPRPPLAEQLRGRTLVLLDNQVDTKEGERRAMQFVSKDQLLRFAAGGGHAMIAGEGPRLSDMLVPAVAAPETAPVPERAYLDGLSQARSRRPVAGAPPDLVEVSTWMFFGPPKEQAIEKRALELGRALRHARPAERHVLVWDHDPQVKKDYLLFKVWKMGTVAVHRTLDATPAALTAVRADDAALHDGAFAFGRDATTGLVLALPFDEKLRRLAHLTGDDDRPPPEHANEDDDANLERTKIDESSPAPGPLPRSALATLVADALLADLANEQLAVLHRGWCAGATPRALRNQLPLLRTLVTSLFDGVPVAGRRAAHAIRILARLQFFASSQVRFWEYLPPISFERRAPVLRGVTRKLVAEAIRRLFGGPDPDSREGKASRKAAAAEVSAEQKRLALRYEKARREHQATGTRAEYARELLLSPLARKAVTTSAEVLVDPADRVLSKDTHEVVLRADEARADGRRALMTTAANARAELLRSETCAQLVARAAGRVRVAAPAAAPDPALAAVEAEAASFEDLPWERRANP